MAEGRGNWSGTLGFVLAAMGSAVGLGNIWRFPYVAGENGGGAFVLVYVACVAAVGLPLMLAEVVIGRRTQRNPVGAFGALRPGSAWPLVGWLGVAAGFAKIPMEQGARGVAPFVLVQISLLLLLVAFPEFVLVPLGWFG